MRQFSIIAVIFVTVGLFVLAKAKTVIDSRYVYVPEGDKLMIECIQHEGKGIKWSKSSGVTAFTVANNIENGKTISHLIVVATKMSDDGTYRCENTNNATDGQNVIVNIFSFTVTMNPKIVAQVNEVATAMCNVSIPTVRKRWFHANVDVQEMITDGNNNFEIINNNDTLKILDVDSTRIGVYTCRVIFKNDKSFSRSTSLDSSPYLSNFDKSKNLVHGEPLTLTCSAWGYPKVNYSWYMNGRLLHDDGHISFADENNETLKIAKIEFSDRGDYTCVASNIHGSDNSTILIRVKDKLAALWPFLGICAEVIILCTIIFVYEKVRAKKRAQEDLMEEEEHMTTANSNDHKGAEEIRQRK